MVFTRLGYVPWHFHSSKHYTNRRMRQSRSERRVSLPFSLERLFELNSSQTGLGIEFDSVVCHWDYLQAERGNEMTLAQGNLLSTRTVIDRG